MNPQLIQLFRDALDVATGERSAFLDANCADAAMRAQIDALLAASESTGRPQLERAQMPDFAAVTADMESRLLDRSGQIVGPYRLTTLLGSGGMGAVWKAERVDGFAQTVAIKWAHAAGLSAATLMRFTQERQLLAKLNHPGIARILDGGNDAGALWFAMEYVDGMPLDHYIKALKPSLEARLKIVIELCAAVQYAHQNLIVHRDLKPSNIMVLDGGRPKLLDFGIAKQLGGIAELTQSHAPMTFNYAAPEQIRGDAITTSVDVYALGVILFELLTGERPHKPKGDGSLSLLQAITDTDATAPSSALKIQTKLHSSIRPSQLKGDLDTIVLKALSREPARRYGSAVALSEDINAYLEQRPIRARPDSASYRLLKFVRRNALASSVFALAFVAVFAGLSSALMASQREARALRAAATQSEANKQVSAFLVSLFEAAAPEENLGKPLSALEMLDIGWQRLQSTPLMTNTPNLPGAPAPNDASPLLALAMGESFYGLGEFKRARDAFEYALAHSEASGGQSTSKNAQIFQAETTLKLAGSYAELVDFAKARKLVMGLQGQLTALAMPTLDLRTYRLLGFIERDAGNYTESAKAIDVALAIAGLTRTEKAGLYTSLGFTKALAREQSASVAAFAQAESLTADLPEMHPARIWLDYIYGDALRRLRDFHGADLRLERALLALSKMPRAPAQVLKFVHMARAALVFAQGKRLTPELIAAARLERLPDRDLSLPEIELHGFYGHWLKQHGQDQLGALRLEAVMAGCMENFGAAHPYCIEVLRR